MTDDHPWRDLFETGATAFYDGRYNAGRAACERLLELPDLPAEVRAQTRQNAVFYAPTLASLVPGARTDFVRFPVPAGWSRSNPSIAATDAGYRLVVRSSNYRLDGWWRYTVNDLTGTVRTVNYLMDLDESLACPRVSLIDDAAVRDGVFPFPVHGFEDARLFRHRDDWYVTATVRDRNPDGICQIAWLRLDGTRLRDLRFLSDAATGVHEKNWMPVPGGDHMRFVYGCSPTVILRHDDETGAVQEERRYRAPAIAQDFRGGSQLVPVDDGHLGLIHESIDFERAGRAYPHRFVRFNQELAITHVSPLFFFLTRGTEFAAGLARRGDHLLASFGWWDREAVLATMPLPEVLATLRPTGDAPTSAKLAAAPFDDGPDLAPAEPPASFDVRPDDLPGNSGMISPEPTTARTLAAGFTPAASQAPLSLISVTIANNARDLIGDALRSVLGWVDRCLVIDAGITDDTLQIAREIAGPKLIVRDFAWCDDFAAARNFALDAATTLGTTWAVTLDTDERLDPGPVDIRAMLATTPESVLSVISDDGTYAKERFFRLPRRGRFEGPTHEAFVSAGVRAQLAAGVTFTEVPKTEAGYRQKFERDAAILSRHAARCPDEPRWLYYLGDALQGLGRYQEAISAYRQCAALDGWDEEAAWACYRAAECWLDLDDPAAAIESCALGLRYHAGMAELPWLAGYAAWQLGRPDQAARWARLAIALGWHAGHTPPAPRHGFRYPPALYEGPYDVLRFALQDLGDDAGAERAAADYEAARQARLLTSAAPTGG